MELEISKKASLLLTCTPKRKMTQSHRCKIGTNELHVKQLDRIQYGSRHRREGRSACVGGAPGGAGTTPANVP